MKIFIKKKLSVVAFLGAFALGSVMMGGSFSSAPVAHAAGLSSCSVATAMSDSVSDANPKTGETITYTLEGAPAFTASTTITVTDTLGTGLTFVSSTPSVGTYSSSTGTWNVGTLNGASFISLAITATVNANATGTIVNTPSINYVQSNCTQSSAAGSAPITIQAAPVIVTPTSTPATADLSISKTADVTSTTDGGTVHYTVAVTNLSSSTTSTDVVATDLLPSGLTFENATASASTSYASSTGTWTIGDLSPSSTATLDIAALVNASTTGTITNTATVSASTTDSNTTNNSSSVSVVVTPLGSCTLTPAQFEAAVTDGQIILGNVLVSSTNSGGTSSFTIVNGTNCGALVSLASYEVFESGIAPTFLSTQQLFDSTSTTVGASSTQTLVVNLPVCEAQIDAYYGQAPVTLVDNALIYSYPNVPFGLGHNFSRIGDFCISTPSADVAISKTADVTSTTEGGTVNYTVAVTDLGPATSTDVVATDTLPSTLTFVSATTSEGFYASSTGIWTIGDMSASSTATLTIAAKVNTGTASSTITNTASVAESASTTDPNLANNSSSVSVVVAPLSSCSLTPAQFEAAVTDGQIVLGDVLASTTNTGGTGSFTIVNKTNCGALISLASYEVFELGISPTFLSTQQLFDSTFTTVGASSTQTLTVSLPTCTAQIDAYYGQAPVTLVDNALVYSYPNVPFGLGHTFSRNGNGTGSLCGNVVPPSTNADIAISKTADVTSTTEGGTINYTITVTANGPQPSTDVVAADTLPLGLTFENATASASTSYASSTGTWTIGTLGPNATATLTIRATVNPSASSTITNTAMVSESSTLTDTNLSNNSSSVTVAVLPNVCTSDCIGGTDADLAVTKTVDNANPAVGDTVNYTVTVTDNGPAEATFVHANDQLPSGLGFVSATTSQGVYNMSDWNIGTISPNATATMMIAATVEPGDAGVALTNTASVTSQLSSWIDGNLANNSSSVTIDVQSAGCTSNCGGGGGGGGGSVQSNIAIVKTVDDSTPAAGAIIHYTLTVTDSGPSDSFGVTASDILPAGVTFDSASSSEGSYVSSTGVWTIGAIADGQSATLVITATVNAAGGTTITNTGTVSENPGIINATPGNASSSVSITVAGGNGGGGGNNSGGGGGGGEVLGASTSTGQVLGASCGLYLTSYIHPFRQSLNDPTQVKKLQTFLNMNLGLNLPVTGVYNAATIAAVNQFQVKYHIEVLAPWLPLGLPTQFTPTSYVYQTTQRWINLIMCPPLNLPVPALKVDNGGE